MTTPKLIIFDWDGTLADTTQPIIDTMRRSFAECGFPPPEAERVRSLIGYSLPEIIRDLLEMPSETAIADITRTYSAHYLNPNNRNMTLFPDALPCLDKLKAQGYWLAVATGKGRAGLDNAISQTATGGYWLATACAGEYPSKPSPEMVFGICGELGSTRKRHWSSAIRRMTCIWRQTQARRQSALPPAHIRANSSLAHRISPYWTVCPNCPVFLHSITPDWFPHPALETNAV